MASVYIRKPKHKRRCQETEALGQHFIYYMPDFAGWIDNVLALVRCLTFLKMKRNTVNGGFGM